MLRQRKLWRTFAALSAAALLATACGGGEGEGEGEAEDPGAGDETTEAAAGGEFSVYVCEPESLVPQNTNETCGAEVLNALFSGLVDYDPETAEPLWGDDSEKAHAESIESDDQQTWTITLKDGWTFHDGTPVTAQSYVDAWNYAAYAPNAQGNNYFFGNVEGYDALNPAPPEGETEAPEPEAEELSGLEAVDESTIEVTLSQPFSQYPLTVGYTAFYPLPEAFFDDPDAFEQAPIGNGPFQMEGEWQHDQAVNVVRYDDWGGGQAQADAIEFRIYGEITTAFTDLQAGNLDIMDSLPPEQLDAAQEQFGDAFIEGDSSSFTYVGFPTYDEAFQDPQLRQAFSQAIDRQPIIDAIFSGTLTPADAMVNPVVNGYREGACGELCEFDPEAAKEKFDAAGGYDGTLTLWFNSGAGHEEWMEAVSNQLRDNLGIEDIEFESLQFADYLGRLDAEEITGPFRLGWVMDYPSMQNYLEPIHGSQGSSNNTGYSSEEFDDLIAQGNQAASIEEGVQFYQQAEDVLIQDMPIIPMWFGKVQAAHSENVSGVIVDPFTRINTADITVNQ